MNTDEAQFQQRLDAAIARVDCPFCDADLIADRCESCGHDPSTRATPAHSRDQ